MRVLIVANKSWEVDPLVNVLVSDRAIHTSAIGDIHIVNHPYSMKQRRAPDPAVFPRIEVELTGRLKGSTLEVWCIQDLMNPLVSGSSTLEKTRVLPRMMSYEERGTPGLVVAFGTAGAPPEIPLNGSVVIGSSVFLHDPFAGQHDPDVHWRPPRPDELIPSGGLPSNLFRRIEENIRFPVEGRFLRTPIRPAEPPVILAGHAYVALGNINITNYDDYAWADLKLLESFDKVVRHRSRVGSLETTHCVIREIAGDDVPFLFVSGVADAIGRFDYDVGPRVYLQNFVAAHNAGVAVAWLIPELAAFIAP